MVRKIHEYIHGYIHIRVFMRTAAKLLDSSVLGLLSESLLFRLLVRLV